jgi:hypothetical protein
LIFPGKIASMFKIWTKKMIRLGTTKAVVLSGLVIASMFCWRFDPFIRLGVVPVSYLVGHYERNLSEGLSVRHERWFSTTSDLQRVESWYSMLFGMKFRDGEQWKQQLAYPGREEIGGRKFVVNDIRFELQGNGYFVRLFKGHWVNDSQEQEIVLINVYSGLF